MASDSILVMPALGRPFTLGMLYDKRIDELVPGITLWDDETLQKNIKESHQPESEIHISASDSTESKSSMLDLNASLEASLFGGLLKVGGSAKYLNDNKKYHNQCRVTFQYKATTTFKQLSMTYQTNKKRQVDSVIKNMATHVVTGILYGANAFFVFDSEKLDASSVEDIQGSVTAVIKLIPSFNIDGKVDIKLNQQQQELVDTFSCTFFGDLLLKSNPSTFGEAVKVYVNLPQLLGDNSENAVPLKVWLTPLKNFDPQAAEVKKMISVGLVREAEETLEDVKKIKMRCNDCLQIITANTLPQIHDQLITFQRLCNYYTGGIQAEIATKLPLIREDKADESSLKQIFDDRDQSPFSHAKLTDWIELKEREINIIWSCVEMMPGIKIISNQSELDKEVLNPGVNDVFCFVFTSLEMSDPYLEEMAKYVDSFHIQNMMVCTPQKWCYSDKVLTKMREKARQFCESATAKKNNSKMAFFIAAIANKSYEGASIYHYQNGVLVSDDACPPNTKTVNLV